MTSDVSLVNSQTPESQGPEGQTRTERGLWHYIGVGLSAGLLAVVLLLALLVIVVPKVAGATPLTILTTSMEPRLPPGTLIVVKPMPIDQITVGDVMTYQIRSGDPAVISHRVITITSSSDGTKTFTTKGDNNAEADPPVSEPQVRGIVWYSVPWIGYVNSALNGPGRSLAIPVIAVVLLGYAAYMLTSGLLGALRRRRTP
ncbi:signal peptidase I [Diaminobutyricibacter sp. McL0618]|uniref:signal peptidase I n=1 Tax=Leifsonia sp. McL0618 TaxID=3415677 RepID=UPI003CF9309B